MNYIFISITIVLLTSLSGVIFIWKPMHVAMQKNVHYFVTFAIGVFSVIAYKFFTEAVFKKEPIVTIIIATFLGVIFLEIISRLIPNSHHHHNTGHRHSHGKIDAQRLLISHSMRIPIDGLIITSSFMSDIRIGIIATSGIVIHEIIQNISQFFVLKEAQFSNKKALLLSLLASSAIIIGVVLGIFATVISKSIPFILSFAGGAFVYVIIRDLLPSSLRSIHGGKAIVIHIVAAILGILLMISIGFVAQEPSMNTVSNPVIMMA